MATSTCGDAANVGNGYPRGGTRQIISIVLTVARKGFIKMKKKIDLSNDISFEEYLFIANSLSLLQTITQHGMDSCIENNNYDKYNYFFKYKKMCKRLEEKIRAGLE